MEGDCEEGDCGKGGAGNARVASASPLEGDREGEGDVAVERKCDLAGTGEGGSWPVERRERSDALSGEVGAGM